MSSLAGCIETWWNREPFDSSPYPLWFFFLLLPTLLRRGCFLTVVSPFPYNKLECNSHIAEKCWRLKEVKCKGEVLTFLNFIFIRFLNYSSLKAQRLWVIWREWFHFIEWHTKVNMKKCEEHGLAFLSEIWKFNYWLVDFLKIS